jgi:hypothetical protein
MLGFCDSSLLNVAPITPYSIFCYVTTAFVFFISNSLWADLHEGTLYPATADRKDDRCFYSLHLIKAVIIIIIIIIIAITVIAFTAADTVFEARNIFRKTGYA